MDTSSISPTAPEGAQEPGSAPGQSAPSGSATSSFNASTPITSLADLKDKAPEVYKAMMEGIAQNIINKMNDHQERLKKLMREGRRDAEG
jgi:hypothetical protein